MLAENLREKMHTDYLNGDAGECQKFKNDLSAVLEIGTVKMSHVYDNFSVHKIKANVQIIKAANEPRRWLVRPVRYHWRSLVDILKKPRVDGWPPLSLGRRRRRSDFGLTAPMPVASCSWSVAIPS